MYQRVHAQCKEAAEIQVLKIRGRRLHHHLKLVVVLQPVRIFPVAPVCRPTTGLHIGRIPVLRAQCTQKSGGVKGARSHLHIQWLQDYATQLGPVVLQAENNLLKCRGGHGIQPKNRCKGLV